MQDVFRSISAIFRDAKAGTEAQQAVVFAAWKRAAGPQLSAHAVPVKFDMKRLTVAVSGVRWKQQMEDLGGQMVFRLNAAFGAPVLNFIEFVVDETAVREVLERSGGRSTEPGKYRGELSPEILAAAASIKDPKLRTDFLAAAGECIERPSKLKH